MTTNPTAPRMLLHEAMRLGAALTTKGIGGGMSGIKRCALACVHDATGIEPVELFVMGQVTCAVDYAALCDRFPVLLEMMLPPTEWLDPYYQSQRPLFEIIYVLNDKTNMSREQIADWLQPIEEAFMASQQPVIASTEQLQPVPVTV